MTFFLDDLVLVRLNLNNFMLSAIVITKNEERMIEDCLKSLSFADELIVVDTGNTDKTNDIARKYKAKIISSSATSYAEWRNVSLPEAKGEWILFVDADERVSQELAQEIQKVKTPGSYLIPRKNNYLGKFMDYGGWGKEKLLRLFYKSNLNGYINELHEQPQITGDTFELKNPLLHYSHRDLSSMLEKSLQFTAIESKNRLNSNHPRMSWWRFFRVMLTEFYIRFIKYQAWRDGIEGIIDGMFQVYNTFIIYARLWELQISK